MHPTYPWLKLRGALVPRQCSEQAVQAERTRGCSLQALHWSIVRPRCKVCVTQALKPRIIVAQYIFGAAQCNKPRAEGMCPVAFRQVDEDACLAVVQDITGGQFI